MVSSTSGLLGNVGQCNYGAAKFGIVALARIVAMENASKGITVNVICPSADTRMTRSVRRQRTRRPRHCVRRGCAAAARRDRPALRLSRLRAGEHVNGQVFHQRAGELSLYGHMRPVRMVHRQGGWTPETLAEVAIPALAHNSPARRRPQRPSGPADGVIGLVRKTLIAGPRSTGQRLGNGLPRPGGRLAGQVMVREAAPARRREGERRSDVGFRPAGPPPCGPAPRVACRSA